MIYKFKRPLVYRVNTDGGVYVYLYVNVMYTRKCNTINRNTHMRTPLEE